MAVITPQPDTQNDPMDWFKKFQNQDQALNANPPTAADPNQQGATSGDMTDPQTFLNAYVAQHQNDPDFDPSLITNQPMWLKYITDNGGLGDASKQAYWSDKFKTARGQSATGGSPGTLGGMGNGSLLSAYGQSFQQPTEQDALNSPGLQFALKQGQNAIESSAFARGTGLTGGTLKALERYGTGTALQGYNDVFNRNLSQFNTNYNLWDRQRNFVNDTQNQTADRGVRAAGA